MPVAKTNVGQLQRTGRFQRQLADAFQQGFELRYEHCAKEFLIGHSHLVVL